MTPGISPVRTISRAMRWRPLPSASAAGTTRAAAQQNRAVRLASGMSSIWASSNALFAASSPWRPHQRADRMPGAPPITSTIRPESSATAGSPVRSATSRALSSEFSSKVTPSSTGSGRFIEPADTSRTPAARSPRHSSRIWRISASLPSLWVATTIVRSVVLTSCSFRWFALPRLSDSEAAISNRSHSEPRGSANLIIRPAPHAGRPEAPCCPFRPDPATGSARRG